MSLIRGMVLEFTLLKMENNMKVNGNKANSMVKESIEQMKALREKGFGKMGKELNG